MVSELYRLEYAIRQLQHDAKKNEEVLQQLKEQIEKIEVMQTKMFDEMKTGSLVENKRFYYAHAFHAFTKNLQKLHFHMQRRHDRRVTFTNNIPLIFETSGGTITQEDFEKLVDCSAEGAIFMLLFEAEENARNSIIKKMADFMRDKTGSFMVKHSEEFHFIWTEKPTEATEIIHNIAESKFVENEQVLECKIHYDVVETPMEKPLDHILKDMEQTTREIRAGRKVRGTLQNIPLDIEGNPVFKTEREREKTSADSDSDIIFNAMAQSTLLISSKQNYADLVAKKLEAMEKKYYKIGSSKEWEKTLEALNDRGVGPAIINSAILINDAMPEGRTLVDVCKYLRDSGFGGTIYLLSEAKNPNGTAISNVIRKFGLMPETIQNFVRSKNEHPEL